MNPTIQTGHAAYIHPNIPGLQNLNPVKPELRPQLAAIDHPGCVSFKNLSDVVHFQQNRVKANQLTDLKEIKRFFKENGPATAGLSPETLRTMNSATLKMLTLFIGAVDGITGNKDNEALQNKAAAIVRHALGVPSSSLTGKQAEANGKRPPADVATSTLAQIMINWQDSLAVNALAGKRSQLHIRKDLASIEYKLNHTNLSEGEKLSIVQKLVMISYAQPDALVMANQWLDSKVETDIYGERSLPRQYLDLVKTYFTQRAVPGTPASISNKALSYTTLIARNLDRTEFAAMRATLAQIKNDLLAQGGVDPRVMGDTYEAYKNDAR